jgi:hypothetical protein
MEVKSSWVNDQFAVPTVIVPRSQRRLEALQHSRATLAKDRPWLPRDVLAKELRGVDCRPGAEISERGNPTKRGFAEEIPAVLALHPTPHETAGCHATEKSDGHVTHPLRTHDIARLAVSA